MRMTHYVYKIEDPITKEFYFGSRSFDGNITDDNYKGSYLSWRPKNKKRLVKTILKSNFRKRETCMKYEASIIKENIDDPLNRNYHVPGSKFYTLGLPMSSITKEKISKSKKGKSLPSFTESHKKKISNSNMGKLASDQARLNMSIAQKNIKPIKCPHCNKIGTHNMKRYHFDNCKLVNPMIERYKTSTWKGYVIVEDISGNKTEYVSMTEASRILKVDVHSISNHIKNNTSFKRGIYKNWKFTIKNDKGK